MIAKKMVPDLGHGKGHGKSWKFKSSKEYEPCEGQALALWKPMDLGYSDSNNNVMCCMYVLLSHSCFIFQGTAMFLHWLVGMVYVFYFASFVLLLREVLRPGVLWFLRNLNDPDFHPVQEVRK